MKWLCEFQQHHHSKNKSQKAAQTLLPKLLGSRTMDPTPLERLYLLHLQTKTVKRIKLRTVSLSLCPSSHVQNIHYNSTYVCTAVHRCCQILHYKNSLTNVCLAWLCFCVFFSVMNMSECSKTKTQTKTIQTFPAVGLRGLSNSLLSSIVNRIYFFFFQILWVCGLWVPVFNVAKFIFIVFQNTWFAGVILKEWVTSFTLKMVTATCFFYYFQFPKKIVQNVVIFYF